MQVAEILSDPPINFVSGKVRENRAWLGQSIQLPIGGHLAGLADGDFTFGIRCNHLFLKPSRPEDLEIRAMVELSEINGSETFIHLSYENHKLVVQDRGVHQLKIGREIPVYVNPCHFFVFDAQGDLAASPDRTCLHRSVQVDGDS